MSDPNVYPNFPGFPQESNKYEPPPFVRDPTTRRLHPAISRKDQDQSVGEKNRSRFGPPPGGWPVGTTIQGMTPLKQRLVLGMRTIAEQFSPQFGPNVQMLTGAIMGVLEEKVKDAPDAAIVGGLHHFEGMIRYWLEGEDSGSTGNPPADTPSAGSDGTNQAR